MPRACGKIVTMNPPNRFASKKPQRVVRVNKLVCIPAWKHFSILEDPINTKSYSKTEESDHSA